MFKIMMYIELWYDTINNRVILNHKIFPDYNPSEISKLVTKSISEYSKESDNLKLSSKRLMDIRDLVNKI